jgi:hypothetical protein
MTGIPLSHVAPTGRKPRSAEALVRLVHTGFDHIPDERAAEADMSLTEARMAAFALFSRTSPARLACDQERTAGNVHTIYGSQRVPCDPHLRERRDPVSPESLRPLFKRVLTQGPRGTALEPLVCLDDRS